MVDSGRRRGPVVTDGRLDLFDAVLNGRLEIKKLSINTNLGKPVGRGLGRFRWSVGRSVDSLVALPAATIAALNSHAEERIFHENGASVH